MVALTLAGCHSRSTFHANNDEESDFAAARRRMVEEQLKAPGRDIKNPRVLAALAAVPRHEFVPAAYRGLAFEDHPLPIGHG